MTAEEEEGEEEEEEEEEEWTTLKHRHETNVPPSLSSYEEEEEEDGTTCVSSVSEAIDIALRAFESRAEMYSRVKRAHGDVLERVRRGERGESSSSVAFVEYEKSLAAFASDMNELNGKLKHVLQYLAREEEEEEKEEEDEKRVCFQLLKSVQEQEKEKLRLTTVEMALKTHYEMKNWSWQQDGYVEEEEEREEREEEKENASSASALKPSWATYVDGEKNDAYEGQRKCCEEAPEPTKIEFENAMKETTVGLENCIQTINDAREELLEIKASYLSL
jgi:hypothetical protein